MTEEHLRIIYRHILPHVLTLSLLCVVFGAAWAILTESSLSFLGLGDPDALSWGLMLNQAFDSGAIRNAWWWVLPPGCALMLLVVGIYLLAAGSKRPSNAAVTLQSVRGLSVRIGAGMAIEGVTFDIAEGRSFGLVEESVSWHRTARTSTARDEPAALA